MRKLYALVFFSFFYFTARAQYSLTTTNYTQDFNSLATSGTSSILPAGWVFNETGTNADGMYTAGNGSLNTGDTYSFGTGTNVERALGGLQSGALIPAFGFYFTNNTGTLITGLSISYTGEQWRLGAIGRTDRLDFQYSTDATSLITGSWADYDPLDATAPVTTGTTGALDGNLFANQVFISGSLTGLNIPDGSSFFIRWSDFNSTGADDGISIDDFAFTVTSTPPSTDYFRSVTSGNWNVVSTWESSPDNITWAAATMTPTSSANTITIRNSHTVTITSSVTVDQLEIENGGIIVNDLPAGQTLTINNGGTAGDLLIRTGGKYQVITAEDYNSHFSVQAGAVIHIETGGTIQIGNGGSVGSDNNLYASTLNSFDWDDGAIFNWNTSSFPGIQTTFFPAALTSEIPIFRFSSSIGGMGGGSSTIINGRLESTQPLTFQGTGNKTFRNGIITSATINGSASGTFIINGTTAQLGGTGSITTPATGMEIGTGTTVTLTTDFTVDGNITLLSTNSIVQLGDYDLLVTGIIGITEKTSYVKTNGTGRLLLSGVSSGFFGKLFPIGNSTINPLYINSTGSQTYAARVVEPITPPIYNDNYAVLRTWYISSDADISGPNSVISFGYSHPGDTGPFFNNSSLMEIGVHIVNWNIHQAGLNSNPFALVPGTYYVRNSVTMGYFTNAATEYPFAIAMNGAILSLDCIIFARSEKLNGQGIISWELNSCSEVAGFTVERSVNGGAYTPLGTVTAGPELNYRFTDPSPARGLNAYRIRVNGIRGNYKYSNIVSIFSDDPGILLSIAPNPVINETTVTLNTGRAIDADFILQSANGQLIRQWHRHLPDGTTEEKLDLSNLSQGVYLLSLRTEGGVVTQRILKQ